MIEEDLQVPIRITDFVDRFAEETPGGEAVVFGDERVTYEELKHRVDRFGRALLASGVEKGDRVAMLTTSRTEFWVAFLATAGIGAIWVGLNPKYRLEELRYVVGDCAPRLLFAQAAFEGRSYEEEVATLRTENASLEDVVAFGGVLPGTVSLEHFLARADGVSSARYLEACQAVERLDPVLIVYTSGSTGRPKGAMLSHYGLTYGATLQTTHFQVEHPSLVCPFPANHVASVADTCCTTLVRGGKIVFHERFDPGAVLADIAKERCTLWGGVPTMIQLQLSHPDFAETDVSSVELILWAGAAMPRDGIRELQKLGARLLTAYGMTETSAHTTYSEEGASIDVLAESVGKPDPRIPCRIMRDEGEPAGVGETGELQFKSELMMLGYWNRPEATLAAFTEDGWMRTGDTGFWREDGNIQLVGRLSEMFKSGGYNVYPREVEIALEELPAVAMAAVIGVPDELYQEVGHAYILLEPDRDVSEDELRDYCRGRLANYKVPKRFFPRRELPMLPVGKIDKPALRRAASGPAEATPGTE